MTVVPPFNSIIYSNGSMEVAFRDVPSSHMDYLSGQAVRVPGTAFGNSARAVVANVISRMKWLRRHTIDDESLAQEDEHYLYGRDPYYGKNLSKPNIRLISPGDGVDSAPLLPTSVELKGISSGSMQGLLSEAYDDLSSDEKNLYQWKPPSLSYDSMKQNLLEWRSCYDRVESEKSEWMPFRQAYDSQFTASGRATRKDRSWQSAKAIFDQSMQDIRNQRIARLAQLQALSNPSNAPAQQQQTQNAQGGDDDNNDNDRGRGTRTGPAPTEKQSKRIDAKHVFYVALEQEPGTDQEQRQLYRVTITMFLRVPFKAFEDLSIKSPENEAEESKPLIRLGQYLSRIPDRARIESVVGSSTDEPSKDVASRNPSLMLLRNMLVLSPDVDAIAVLDQLFSNKIARPLLTSHSDDNLDTMKPFLERLESVGLLKRCSKLAMLVSNVESYLGVANCNVLKEDYKAVHTAILATSTMAKSFVLYTEKAFDEYREFVRSLLADATLLQGQTPDTDTQNVAIAVDTLRLVSRVKEPKNLEALTVSPARDEDLKRVIYRAVCRLGCGMSVDVNRQLDRGKYPGHMRGLYVVYKSVQ
jgi:hypothetical protein